MQLRLDDLEVVYLWADGLYVKAGLEDTRAALLVMIGALTDGRKVVLAVESGVRESKESWGMMLRDLRKRGLKPWRCTIADGHLGLWAALGEQYPQLNQTTEDSYTSSLAVEPFPFGLSVAKRSRRSPDSRLACSSTSPLTRLRSERTASVFSTCVTLCQCSVVRFSRAEVPEPSDYQRAGCSAKEVST